MALPEMPRAGNDREATDQDLGFGEALAGLPALVVCGTKLRAMRSYLFMGFVLFPSPGNDLAKRCLLMTGEKQPILSQQDASLLLIAYPRSS